MDSTDRKADALRVIAARWDEMHDGLTAGQGLTPDEATDALVALSRGFAHPDLDATAVHEWMTEVRDAIHKLTGYENGWVPVADIADWHADDETCLSLLNADIDNALFPLLMGVTVAHVCIDCQRTLSDVRRWQRMERGAHCAYHADLFAEQLAWSRQRRTVVGVR